MRSCRSSREGSECDRRRSARSCTRGEATGARSRDGVPEAEVGIEKVPLTAASCRTTVMGKSEYPGRPLSRRRAPRCRGSGVGSTRRPHAHLPPVGARRDDAPPPSQDPVRDGRKYRHLGRPHLVGSRRGGLRDLQHGHCRPAYRPDASALRPGASFAYLAVGPERAGAGARTREASPPVRWIEPKREPNEERRQHVDARGNQQQEPERDRRGRKRRARVTDRPVGSGRARAWRGASPRNRDQGDQPRHEQNESRRVGRYGARSWTHGGTASLSREPRWR